MSASTYTISTLADYARLDEIHRLTYDTLLETGDITPRPDQRIAFYPHLDQIPNTTILVAERQGAIIGTNSVTLDGPMGLHTDLLFKQETDRIRQELPGYLQLGSSWRIATAREYRSQRSLVLALLKRSILEALERHVDVCLMVFNQRHVPIYRRLLHAEVVAEQTDTLDGAITVSVALMKVDVMGAWQRFERMVGV